MKFNSFLFEKELTLQFNKTLQPDLWDLGSDNAEPELKADVRKKLLQIADAWAEYANIPKKNIKNVLFTGSLANYNWTSLSDIDLHVLVDYDAISKDFDFLYDYFKDKKALWAENHEITIKGYPVEMYAQPMSEKPHTNQGVYSVSSNRWIKAPEPVKVDVEGDVIFMKKLDAFKEQIDDIINGKGSVASIEKFREKIRKMRGAAISKAGEFSQENLIFKELRNSGYLDKLAKYHHELIDKKLSLESEKQKSQKIFEEVEKAKLLRLRTEILNEADEEEYEEAQGYKKDYITLKSKYPDYKWQHDASFINIGLSIRGDDGNANKAHREIFPFDTNKLDEYYKIKMNELVAGYVKKDFVHLMEKIGRTMWWCNSDYSFWFRHPKDKASGDFNLNQVVIKE